MERNAAEVWELLRSPDTYCYVAGLKKAGERLERTMIQIAGSRRAWDDKKRELQFFDRWTELLYE